VVQQNAAGTEESASASQQMSSQADLLKTIVSELVTLVGADTEKKRTNHPQMITSGFADLDESPEARSTAKKIEPEGKVAVRKADAPDPEKVIPLKDDF
jgi:hypothetical protein